MEAVTVAIEGKLAMDGAKDINLVVHSLNVGHPSPCVVIEDGINRGAIGGRIDTLDEIFQSEISRHPGYTVKQRVNIVLVTDPQTETANSDQEDRSGDSGHGR